LFLFIFGGAILRRASATAMDVDAMVAELARSLRARAEDIGAITKESRDLSPLRYDPFFLASPVWGGILGRNQAMDILGGSQDFKAVVNPVNRLDDVSILMTRMLGQAGILRSSMTQIQWFFFTENAMVVCRFYIDLWYGRIVREEVRELLYTQVTDARSSTVQWRMPPMLPIWFQFVLSAGGPLRLVSWVLNVLFVAYRKPVLQSEVVIRLTSGDLLDISYDAEVERYWGSQMVNQTTDANRLMEMIREDLLRHSASVSEAIRHS
ncbi:MAG: hypothetical protein AAF602_00220, partial [Myxococcota bacterium]